MRFVLFVLEHQMHWALRHAPVHGSLAVLAGFDGTERFGFWGVEADADGARRDPVVVALDVVPDLTPLGLPFALAGPSFTFGWRLMYFIATILCVLGIVLRTILPESSRWLVSTGRLEKISDPGMGMVMTRSWTWSSGRGGWSGCRAHPRRRWCRRV